MLALLVGGCNTQVTLRPVVDPSGGAISDVEARVYDYDRHGPWYVLFIHADDMLATIHRHDPGMHAFFLPQGDLLFFSRCSGRGETLDVMGHAFSLRNGAIFLCTASAGDAGVRQLPIPPPRCKGNDPEQITKTMFDLSRIPQVAVFLSPEARARLLADWQIALKRKRDAKQGRNPKSEIRNPK
ncbi:MAG TPA: hypothetical protein VFC78_14395 [Tepidisphaeraceae bacterium]|nr:hypothetical protein [Tepidisphaeraceae bacterium]